MKKCETCLHRVAMDGTFCPINEKDMTDSEYCEENYILDPDTVEINLSDGIYILDVENVDNEPHMKNFRKLDPNIMYKIVFVDDEWMIETFEKIAKKEEIDISEEE